MKRILLFAVAFLFVLNISASAKASCTDITIGADILVNGVFKNDYDFDNSVSDSVAKTRVITKINLYNTYTDNVSTRVRIDGKTYDASKGSMVLDRAYIQIKEFLNEKLTVKIGKNCLAWKLHKTFGSEAYYFLSPGDFQSSFVFYTKPVGLDFVYKMTKEISLNFGIGKIKEASVAGNNSNDVDAYYFRYNQKLSGANKFFVGLLYYVDHKGVLPGDIWYFNAGFDAFVAEEALEFYIEFSYQGGDAHSDSYKFGAFAVDFGGEYTFSDIDSVPYIGVEVTYYSGTDGDTYGYIRYNTSWSRTLIGETDFSLLGGLWTMDWDKTGDSNYRGGYFSVKLQGGLKSIADDKFALDVILSFFKAVGDVSGDAKGLGWELDVVASYWYTEDVSFAVGIGYFNVEEDLGGSDADAVLIAIFGVSILF